MESGGELQMQRIRWAIRGHVTDKIWRGFTLVSGQI
jgi:hypothetical protein